MVAASSMGRGIFVIIEDLGEMATQGEEGMEGRMEGRIHTLTRKEVRKGMIDGREGRQEVAEERTLPGLLSAQTSENMRNPTYPLRKLFHFPKE